MSDLIPALLFTVIALVAAVSLVIALRHLFETARGLRAALRQTPDTLFVHTEVINRIVTPIAPPPIRRGARRPQPTETPAPRQAA